MKKDHFIWPLETSESTACLSQQLSLPGCGGKACEEGEERREGRDWVRSLGAPANGLRGAGKPGRPAEALAHCEGLRQSVPAAARPRIL